MIAGGYAICVLGEFTEYSIAGKGPLCPTVRHRPAHIWRAIRARYTLWSREWLLVMALLITAGMLAHISNNQLIADKFPYSYPLFPL